MHEWCIYFAILHFSCTKHFVHKVCISCTNVRLMHEILHRIILAFNTRSLKFWFFFPFWYLNEIYYSCTKYCFVHEWCIYFAILHFSCTKHFVHKVCISCTNINFNARYPAQDNPYLSPDFWKILIFFIHFGIWMKYIIHARNNISCMNNVFILPYLIFHARNISCIKYVFCALILI